MKKEAIGHTKMRRLVAYLDIEEWMAVGLLESIWHLTAREAPRGDIGKLSNEDIALAIGYRRDPDALMAAMVKAGWMDESEDHRLLIHDWSTHAQDAVHMALSRHRELFADGTKPRESRLSKKERMEGNEQDWSDVRTDEESVRTKSESERTNAHAERTTLTNTITEPTPNPTSPTPDARALRAPAPGAKGPQPVKRISDPPGDQHWSQFKAVWLEHGGMDPGPEGWDTARRRWGPLDSEQRSAAVQWVIDRSGKDDFVLTRGLPQNFLVEKKWNRKVREPPMGERDKRRRDLHDETVAMTERLMEGRSP